MNLEDVLPILAWLAITSNLSAIVLGIMDGARESLVWRPRVLANKHPQHVGDRE